MGSIWPCWLGGLPLGLAWQPWLAAGRSERLANLDSDIVGPPSSQAMSCPERVTLMRLTNLAADQGIRPDADRSGERTLHVPYSTVEL